MMCKIFKQTERKLAFEYVWLARWWNAAGRCLWAGVDSHRSRHWSKRVCACKSAIWPIKNQRYSCGASRGVRERRRPNGVFKFNVCPGNWSNNFLLCRYKEMKTRKAAYWVRFYVAFISIGNIFFYVNCRRGGLRAPGYDNRLYGLQTDPYPVINERLLIFCFHFLQQNIADLF